MSRQPRRARRARPRSRLAAPRPSTTGGRPLTWLFGATLGLLLLAFLLLRAAGGPAPREPRVGAPWVLAGTDGKPVTDRAFRGRYVLLYFGYTHCPDVCPTTLDAMTDALRRLGMRARRVQPLFVTVDPGHDTPAVIRAYVGRFGAGLIGLTGNQAQIEAVERDYWVHVARSPAAAGRLDHSAVLYLLAPDGRFLLPISAEASGAAIAHTLERRLDADPLRPRVGAGSGAPP